jgi:heme-degrading monooxygenase HmoA
MVVAIFRNRLRPEAIVEYETLAATVYELARSMPGYRSIKTFTADDGERVSIIEFDSLATLTAWRDHPEHQKAQRLGRERLYAEYHLQVCEPVRAYSFVDGKRTVHEG